MAGYRSTSCHYCRDEGLWGAGDEVTINVFQPSLGQNELLSVADSFNTGWIGKGRKVDEFEHAWANHIGVKPENVTSISCATEGLFQICGYLLREGNEVIIPSIHFIGAANAVWAQAATPVFCDVDPHTLNPNLNHLEACRTPTTRAVIILHYGGVAPQLDAIRQWCDDNDLWLIEDAACAPATTYKRKAAGTWGHFGVFSFDAMKIMSTGDGGMVYCEKPEHVEVIRKSIYLGMDTQSGLTSDKDRWWEFDATCAGRRAIMNDIAAGIGLEQLRKLDGFVKGRKYIQAKYDELLDRERVTIPPFGEFGATQSAYFYWIQTPQRDELARFLRAADVYTTFRYYPLHWVFKTGQSLPGAEQAARETLLLPLHQGLTDDEVGFVCEKVRGFYGGQ